MRRGIAAETALLILAVTGLAFFAWGGPGTTWIAATCVFGALGVLFWEGLRPDYRREPRDTSHK